MAARRHHRRASCYLPIVGLTDLSPVIQMQTFLDSTSTMHSCGKYSLIDVNNNTSHVTSFRIITSEALISLFRITFTNGIPVVTHPCILTYAVGDQPSRCLRSTGHIEDDAADTIRDVGIKICIQL